jgi:hypothetical protein
MSIPRLLVAAPIAAVLAVAGAYAAQRGAGEEQAYEASVEMSTWTAAASQPSEGTWDSVREKVEQAVDRAGGAAEHELLGNLYARRRERAEFLAAGADHLRTALRLRPSSGYSWASVAQVQYAQGQTDAVFETALRRAAEFGAHEPEVQRAVAHLGLAVWEEVGPGTQAAIERLVAAGMRRNSSEMLQISGRRGRLDVACRHAIKDQSGAHQQWLKLCPSTEATS